MQWGGVAVHCIVFVWAAAPWKLLTLRPNVLQAHRAFIFKKPFHKSLVHCALGNSPVASAGFLAII